MSNYISKVLAVIFKFFFAICKHRTGSRDPHSTNDVGAGFVLSWQGNPEIHIAHLNEQQELIQVMSDVMLIAVPE
jgi:hypothetical protein